VRERIFTRVEGMRVKRDRIPDKVLREIFSKKLKRYGASEKVYSQLTEIIHQGKLREGESSQKEK